MTNFTKEQLRTLRAEMQSLLLAYPFEETIDIPIDKVIVDSCTYSGGEATFCLLYTSDAADE